MGPSALVASSGMVRLLRLVALVLVVGYVVWTLPGVRGSSDFSTLFDAGLQGTAYAVLAVLAVVGAAERARTLAPWAAAVAVASRAVGFVVLLSFLGAGQPLTYPSFADAAWVVSYLFLLAALALSLRERAPRLPGLVVLDGLAVALLVAAVVGTLLVGPAVRLLESPAPRSALFVNVAYPLLDTALLVATATYLTVGGVRSGRAGVLLALGVGGFAVVDVVYLILLAGGNWRPGTLLSSLSLVATGLVALAVAWWPDVPRSPRRRVGEIPAPMPAPGIAVAAVVAAASLVGLALSGLTGVSAVPVVAYGLAGVVAVLRSVVTLRGDRRESGHALEQTSADLSRFKALVEASDDFIGMAGLDGAVLYMNPAGRRMLGLDSDFDVTGLTVADITSETASLPFGQRWREIRRSGAWHGETELRPIGTASPVPVAASSFLVRDPHTGEPFAVATIQRDIRERLKTDSDLRELAAQRAHLLERLVEAQEDERGRIAAGVHDDSVQSLAAVGLRLGLLRRGAHEVAPALTAPIEELMDIVEQAGGRLRHLLFDLESPARQGRLVDAIEEAAAFVFTESEVAWSVIGDEPSDMPEAPRVLAYRIASEALVNVRKHARARTVVVEVSQEDDHWGVSVQDDGVGVSEHEVVDQPGHLGMGAMRDRASVAGGQLTVARREAGGTEVRLTIPRPR